MVLKGVESAYGVALEDVLVVAWKNASWRTGKNVDIPIFALKKHFKTNKLNFKSTKTCLSISAVHSLGLS